MHIAKNCIVVSVVLLKLIEACFMSISIWLMLIKWAVTTLTTIVLCSNRGKTTSKQV